MSHNDPDMNPHGLDEQIRAALQVEPSTEQLARIEGFWQRESRAERRRRRMRRTVALAAGALAVVSLSIWLGRQEPAQPHLEADSPTRVAPPAPHPDGSEASQRDVAVQSSGKERSLFAGRPPTTYERLLFAVYTRKSVTGSRPAVPATIDRLIEQLARDPAANPEQLAQSSGLMECDAEGLLLRRLSRSSDDEKHAVLRLLAVCGTPRSTPHLLRLSRREAFRDEALATIQRIVGLERLAEVVNQTADRRVRAALLQRLLTADSEPALRGYLSLVEDEAIRAEAIAAVDAVSQPPLKMLLGLLDDEDEAVRISAALLLGHVNGPDVTDSLITRVIQEPSSPTAAWMALLACRGEQAEKFFAYATRQPQLLAQVNRARVRWARMVP